MKVIDRGKGSKTLSEVKLFENIGKNPEAFLEISKRFSRISWAKEVLL